MDAAHDRVRSSSCHKPPAPPNPQTRRIHKRGITTMWCDICGERCARYASVGLIEPSCWGTRCVGVKGKVRRRKEKCAGRDPVAYELIVRMRWWNARWTLEIINARGRLGRAKERSFGGQQKQKKRKKNGPHQYQPALGGHHYQRVRSFGRNHTGAVPKLLGTLGTAPSASSRTNGSETALAVSVTVRRAHIAQYDGLTSETHTRRGRNGRGGGHTKPFRDGIRGVRQQRLV
ncbi:hypothetical protein ZHAS_00009198 [Anopheles sinensis]|uniref:Uncharacterized protein n=1 Tax=Anopheles sinensis TaxID=74873 RepID=A0A084VU90_ANOSI|nr:hypothetical protein ZHAS_00009198 [Anopheles sinensis]